MFLKIFHFSQRKHLLPPPRATARQSQFQAYPDRHPNPTEKMFSWLRLFEIDPGHCYSKWRQLEGRYLNFFGNNKSDFIHNFDVTMPEERIEDADASNVGEEEGEEEIPSDIMPLFFTSKTQEIFGCKGDEDVSEENPHKLIPKEAILQDFKDRAAVSDFHPVKQIVLVSCFVLVSV